MDTIRQYRKRTNWGRVIRAVTLMVYGAGLAVWVARGNVVGSVCFGFLCVVSALAEGVR